MMDLAGNAGKYQLFLFILLGINNMYTNIESMATNFLSPVHEHWCTVPGLQPDEALRAAVPPTGPGSHIDYESCLMYNVTWVVRPGATESPAYEVDNSTRTECIYGNYFKQGEFITTATSQFNLVCDRVHLLDMISPLYTSGFVIGAFGAGLVSDRFGRRAALVFFNILHLLAGVMVAFSLNEWMYMAARALIGIAVRATNNTGAILLMESISSKSRIRGIIGYQAFYGLGGLALVLFAFFIRDFRYLQLALVTPLVPMIAYRWLFPESPRWLLIKGRVRESTEAILRIAQINQRHITDLEVDRYMKKAADDASVQSKKKSVTGKQHALANPVIQKYLFAFICIMSASNFMFYGISLNIDQLFGDVYCNVLVSILLEFPAYLILWLSLNKFGRKPSVTICMSGITVLCITAIGCHYIPDGKGELAVTLLSVAIRSLSSCVNCAMLCFISEVFPTKIRQKCMGIVAAVAGVCTIFASLTGRPMKSVWEPMPLVLFASISFVSAILTQILPETLGEQLPDTVQDTCNLGRPNRTKSELAPELELRSRSDSPPPDYNDAIHDPVIACISEDFIIKPAADVPTIDVKLISNNESNPFAYLGPESLASYHTRL